MSKEHKPGQDGKAQAQAHQKPTRTPTHSTPGVIYALQATAGNQAVATLLTGGGALIDATYVQRQPPKASVPPPQASVPPSMPKNVFAWQGKLLGPQQSLCRKTLEGLLAELGPAGMNSWAYRFINADLSQLNQLITGIEPKVLEDTKWADAMGGLAWSSKVMAGCAGTAGGWCCSAVLPVTGRTPTSWCSTTTVAGGRWVLSRTSAPLSLRCPAT